MRKLSMHEHFETLTPIKKHVPTIEEQNEQKIQETLSDNYKYFHNPDFLYTLECDTHFPVKIKQIQKNHIRIVNNLFEKHNCNELQIAIMKTLFAEKYWIIAFENEDFSSVSYVRNFLKKYGV